MSRFKATETKEDFEEILDRVGSKRERVIIQRQGKEPVAVVPIDDVKLLEKLEDKMDLKDAQTALEKAKKEGTLPLADVKKELGLWRLNGLYRPNLPRREAAIEKLFRPARKKIIKPLEELETIPRPPGAVKLKGKEDLYRIRTGDYRIITKSRIKFLLSWSSRSETAKKFTETCKIPPPAKNLDIKVKDIFELIQREMLGRGWTAKVADALQGTQSTQRGKTLFLHYWLFVGD